MKGIIIILLLFVFKLQAQVSIQDSIVINPYNIKIVKIPFFKGIKFNDKICGNGCAWMDNNGFLQLKDSSNYINLYFKATQYKILSLFPNLYFINCKDSSLYFIDFKSKILHYYDDGYPNYGKDETNTNCNPYNMGANAKQYIIQTSGLVYPLLVIDWNFSASETENTTFFEGYKILDLNTFQCIFDDIYKITYYLNQCGTTDIYQRQVTIKDDELKISNIFWEEYECGDKLIKKTNINNENKELKTRIPGTYKFINGKFRLIH